MTLIELELQWSAFRSEYIHVLEQSSQSPDYNTAEKLWEDQHSPSELTELERLCKEEWPETSVCSSEKVENKSQRPAGTALGQLARFMFWTVC